MDIIARISSHLWQYGSIQKVGMVAIVETAIDAADLIEPRGWETTGHSVTWLITDFCKILFAIISSNTNSCSCCCMDSNWFFYYSLYEH